MAESKRQKEIYRKRSDAPYLRRQPSEMHEPEIGVGFEREKERRDAESGQGKDAQSFCGESE